MYTPCSVAGRVSATGPQLVVMVGETVVFVHMVVAGLQLVMMGEKVAVYMVVVVTMLLVYPVQLVHPCGRVVPGCVHSNRSTTSGRAGACNVHV